MISLRCRKCGGGDSAPPKGKVLIYPAGNFHESCKKDGP